MLSSKLSWCSASRFVALLPLQRDALRRDARRAHRLPGGTGHLPLTVELELDAEYRPGSEARLRARDEGHLRPAAAMHVQEQLVAVTADGDHGPCRHVLVLAHVAVQDGRGQRDRRR